MENNLERISVPFHIRWMFKIFAVLLLIFLLCCLPFLLIVAIGSLFSDRILGWMETVIGWMETVVSWMEDWRYNIVLKYRKDEPS